MNKHSPKPASKTLEQLFKEATTEALNPKLSPYPVYDEHDALRVITRVAQEIDATIPAEIVRGLMQAIWLEQERPENTLNPDELLHKIAREQRLSHHVTEAIADGETTYLTQIGVIK